MECYPKRKGRSIAYKPSEKRDMKKYEKRGMLCSQGSRYYWTKKGKAKKKEILANKNLTPSDQKKREKYNCFLNKLNYLRKKWNAEEEQRRITKALEYLK